MCRLAGGSKGRRYRHEDGGRSGGVVDIHAYSCEWRFLLNLGGAATFAKGDEVVGRERQTILGVFGEMSEVCANLACGGVDVMKGRRNGR